MVSEGRTLRTLYLQLLTELSQESPDMTVVGANDCPAVLDFWAPWCKNLRYFAPMMKVIEEEYGIAPGANELFAVSRAQTRTRAVSPTLAPSPERTTGHADPRIEIAGREFIDEVKVCSSIRAGRPGARD